MKPSNLRLGQDAFFSSPYRQSQPDQAPLGESSNSSGSSSPAFGRHRVDSTTPLIPPTPTTMEKGIGAYPFPYEEPKSSVTSRMKRMVRGSGRGGVVRKGLAVLVALGLVLVFVRQRGPSAIIALPHIANSTSTFSMPIPSTPKLSIPLMSSPQAVFKSREIDFASEDLPVDTPLKERLEVWKNAPGGRGEVDGEVEPGGFVQWNLEQCSTISPQHNTHMIQYSANIWAVQNRSSIHTHRMDLIHHMEAIERNGTHLHYGHGRGIVMVAGNADTLRRVKWTCQMLRLYGSTLPVQIFHFPSERPALDDPIWGELAELNATLVEAEGQEKDVGKTKSYHLKALSVIQSPWQEVLYLDSDSIPTRDPEYMFDAPNYKRLGIFATPDYWKTSANNPIWAIMGVKCRNEWEMETGQMFIDKKRQLDTFLLIRYMLERHDWWFYFSDGDKDIFRWALLALRKRWAVPGRWVGAAGLPSGTASGEFCAHTMLQHDSWGEPLFVHYNLLKQIPSGIGRGYAWGRTKQLPLFNTFPATAKTARLGEPVNKPDDADKPGLGEVDCDMLADADEYGNARKAAKEMIMRRAARERGVKTRYHGGWISALCIDLDYVDPRQASRQKEDEERRERVEGVKQPLKGEMEVKQKELERLEEEQLERKRTDGEQVDEADLVLTGEMMQLQKEIDELEGQVEEAGLEHGAVYPDWNDSPIEVVQWNEHPNLANFEQTIYDLGFIHGGPGF